MGGGSYSHTRSIPKRVRSTSDAGHMGRLRVVSRSWIKLSKRGLKSSSSFPPLHLDKKLQEVQNSPVAVTARPSHIQTHVICLSEHHFMTCHTGNIIAYTCPNFLNRPWLHSVLMFEDLLYWHIFKPTSSKIWPENFLQLPMPSCR